MPISSHADHDAGMARLVAIALIQTSLPLSISSNGRRCLRRNR